MLLVNELRIGNLIKNLEGTFCKVESLTKVGGIGATCNPVSKKYGGFVEEFDEIPLTEKILMDFGFEKIKISESILGYKKDILYLSNDFRFIVYDDRINYLTTIIKSVHRLQNLYFFLTSEELQLK